MSRQESNPEERVNKFKMLQKSDHAKMMAMLDMFAPKLEFNNKKV